MAGSPVKFVVAANYDIDPSKVAMHLLRQLAQLPIDARVLLRAPLSRAAGPIEQLADVLCMDLSIPTEYRTPEPHTGGEGTIERDFKMVEEADGVIAYFHPDHVMSENRGTTRLVRHAISHNVPVQAFAAGETIDWVGSIEEGSHAST